VSMFEAIVNAFGGQIHEKEIRESIDYLRRILRDHIVLFHVSR
jgi:hypothetical protein